MTANLKVLIGKLNPTCKKAAERAINLCVSHGHYEVDLEHLFLALLDDETSDFSLLAKLYGINRAALERDLLAEMAGFKTGNSRTPVFAANLPTLFEHGWLLASLESHTSNIRSGHLLLALVTQAELRQIANRASDQFGRLAVHELKHKLAEFTAEYPESFGMEGKISPHQSPSVENAERVADVPGQDKNDSSAAKTPALDQFTTNLTQFARDGKIDPVIGRDAEIRQLIDILTRRRQNNPILTGEAGVGKTAVVEGLAQRIADNQVPSLLQNTEIHVLDMGLLQAGASVKGEFENRLRNVIDEIKRSPHPIILFIDEAHTIIGAGGQAGQNDAANLLKPALARGELRTVAATTWSEYKKYFEKDAALARRFQVVKVEEPSEAVACAMLRAMAGRMESHFKVRILESAIIEAVRLSARYVTGRQLPDKAISVLDTACARVALGQTAIPPAIEDARRMATAITEEMDALIKEQAIGAMHSIRIKELESLRQNVRHSLANDESRWEEERVLVDRIQTAQNMLERLKEKMPIDASASGGNEEITQQYDEKKLLQELQSMQDALAKMQGEMPLVPVCVDGQMAGEIVSAWTGIPLGKMMKNEINTVLNLKHLLEERVIGQAHALDQIAKRVRTARASMEDPNKPKGVFLFVGPSGVGKTETALALADILYGGERNLITINMSEYQESHSVSGLKGSPPGYVGYGEGGVLTEAVRRKPHSVVLLDEVEKAHPDVMELFFQVFDKGVMDDAEGREIDFKNTIIILTSNIGTQSIMQACLNKAPEELPDPEKLADMIRPQLFKAFKPAFLGRLKVVPYYPLPDHVLAEIIRLKIERIRKRVEENHKAAFDYTEEVIEAVLNRCMEVDSGARNVDHILSGSMLPEIAESVLFRLAEGKPITKVKVCVTKESNFTYRIS